jgi:hypothetical protein
MSYTVRKGSRLDLNIYQGKSTIDEPIEVLDSSGAAAIFTNYSSLLFKVYYYKHGDLILSPTITNALNVMYLDVTKAQSAALQNRSYWYECYGVLITPLAEEELLTFGFITNE